VCGVTSLVTGKLTGPPESPSFTEPVACGCKARCGVRFRITRGKAERADGGGLTPVDIPAALRDRGVRPPPAVGIPEDDDE